MEANIHSFQGRRGYQHQFSHFTLDYVNNNWHFRAVGRSWYCYYSSPRFWADLTWVFITLEIKLWSHYITILQEKNYKTNKEKKSWNNEFSMNLHIQLFTSKTNTGFALQAYCPLWLIFCSSLISLPPAQCHIMI